MDGQGSGASGRASSELDVDLAARLTSEANQVLVTGSRVSALLGFSAAALLAGVIGLGLARGLEYPALAAFAGGLYSLLFHQLARRRLLHGWRLRGALLGLVSLPTAFFLGSHWLYPAGAATFITGPFSYLYFPLIFLAAFTFDRRLVEASGVVAALGYLGCYLLARPGLATFHGVDPTMTQDVQGAPMYLFKGMMMVFAGLLAGALTTYARGLITRISGEERERALLRRTFGAYVSPAVADRILGAGASAETRRVALLFSDLRGFSAFCEGRSPTEVVAQLNQYFDGMVGAIEASGGVVDKFIGDAVMACFGGVLEVAAPCQAAFTAALEMQARLAAQNQRWQADGLPAFQMGIGLHFGEVVQGAIGSRERKEFTVVGDAVNIASRVEGLCTEHVVGLLLTAEFHAELSPEQRARCRPLGQLPVKGRLAAVDIFAVESQR